MEPLEAKQSLLKATHGDSDSETWDGVQSHDLHRPWGVPESVEGVPPHGLPGSWLAGNF